MSGHNKWSTIRHKKARTDSVRSKAWTKVVREIIISARDGGGEVEFNSRLRLAVQKAKSVNMPKDNIDRAIKRGTGDLEGVHYEELTYEGYGPGGVAIIVDTLTDNKNRTVADVRSIFAKNNGALGESGCVAWQFDLKGLVTVAAEEVDEETLMMDALEAGAEDVEQTSDGFNVTCERGDLMSVTNSLEAAGYSVQTSEFTRIPQNLVPVEGKDAERTVRLWQALEDNDDVQNVYTNADIDDELAAALFE